MKVSAQERADRREDFVGGSGAPRDVTCLGDHADVQRTARLQEDLKLEGTRSQPFVILRSISNGGLS
jgi:hypothetical protein